LELCNASTRAPGEAAGRIGTLYQRFGIAWLDGAFADFRGLVVEQEVPAKYVVARRQNDRAHAVRFPVFRGGLQQGSITTRPPTSKTAAINTTKNERTTATRDVLDLRLAAPLIGGGLTNGRPPPAGTGELNADALLAGRWLLPMPV
jgi:hypothetical protein